MKVSAIVVHYHTPELVQPALTQLIGSSGLDALQILLVDNGGGDGLEEVVDELRNESPEAVEIELLTPGANLGYAGAANLGVRAADEDADVLVLMNCDVLVDGDCVAELVSALEQSEAHIAGPRFFWDEDHHLLQPPAEPTTSSYTLAAAAARSAQDAAGRSAAGARDTWRRHAWTHWRAERPLLSWSLSGALFAFRRSAWEQVGPFDEGFRLYYEETDWLLRARSRGLEAIYVPAAVAVHLYDQSARGSEQARRWFEESAERFRKRHLSRRTRSRLRRLLSQDESRRSVRPCRPLRRGAKARSRDAVDDGSALLVGGQSQRPRFSRSSERAERDDRSGPPACRAGASRRSDVLGSNRRRAASRLRITVCSRCAESLIAHGLR